MPRITWISRLWLVSICLCISARGSVSPELQVYEQLIRNYSRLMRPVNNPRQQLIVNITLNFYQLLDLDEKREVFESVIWIEQHWYDDFLRWDPADNDDVQMLVLPSDVIWVPDLYVLNLVGDANNIVTPFLGGLETLNLFSNGKVQRVSPYRLTTSCAISLQKFPFDRQTCFFTMGSWAYSSNQLYYQIANAPTISPEHTSSDWRLTGLRGKESVYPYGQPVANYSLVVFTLSLQRRPLYHITYLIIPSIMLNMIVSFSFFLPAEAGERVSLGLTSFLAYSVFIMMMADRIPESTTTMPLISVLFLINMTLTMVTILWSVFAIRIHFRGSLYGPAPTWLLRLAAAIESHCCFSLNNDKKAYPHSSAEESNAMLPQKQPSTQGLSKTTSHDTLQRTTSQKAKRNSQTSCLRFSQQNSVDLDHEDIQEKKEAGEGWKLIMCAADRAIFCVFMITTLAGLLLVFLAKA